MPQVEYISILTGNVELFKVETLHLNLERWLMIGISRQRRGASTNVLHKTLENELQNILNDRGLHNFDNNILAYSNSGNRPTRNDSLPKVT